MLNSRLNTSLILKLIRLRKIVYLIARPYKLGNLN